MLFSLFLMLWSGKTKLANFIEFTILLHAGYDIALYCYVAFCGATHKLSSSSW